MRPHRRSASESSQRLASGERKLSYREDITAQGGRKGDLKIPEAFTIGLAPFEGSPGYKVSVRLRYRIESGQLRIGYVLDRPEEVLRTAFNDVLADISAGIGDVPVLRGRPPC
ncbi:MAG: DUF2303 family protein [Nocardioidaceae bacterium]